MQAVQAEREAEYHSSPPTRIHKAFVFITTPSAFMINCFSRNISPQWKNIRTFFFQYGKMIKMTTCQTQVELERKTGLAHATKRGSRTKSQVLPLLRILDA